MKKINYIILSFLLIFTGIEKKVSAQNPYEKLTCCQFCILIPVFIVISWVDGISDAIDESRTLSVRFKGSKGLFKKNTVEGYNKKKGTIEKGSLLKKITLEIRGRRITILPGSMSFHENGNIAECSIEEAELLTGDNSLIRCRGSIRFHEDEFLESFVIDEYSEERLFNIQGRERSLSGRVNFNKKGVITEATIKNEEVFIVGDYSVPLLKGTRVQFSGEWKPVYIRPPYGMSVSLKFRDKFISLSDDVMLNEKGDILSGKLVEPMIIQNGQHKLRIRGRVSFYDNGFIRECRLTNPVRLEIKNNTVEFDNSPEWGEHVLTFHKNGVPDSGTTVKNRKQVITQNGQSFLIKDGYAISFHENGTVRKLYPAEGGLIRADKNSIELYDSPVIFYEDGSILSAHIVRGSEFNYQGTVIKSSIYSCMIFFNRGGEVIAFTNSEAREVFLNGKTFILPRFYVSSYEDYTKNTVSFIRIDDKKIRLPQNVEIKDNDEYSDNDIFVKAENFINDKGNETLSAEGVKEIMFSEDTVILIDGREHLCRAMTWVGLAGGNN